jgi:hypothetical protein
MIRVAAAIVANGRLDRLRQRIEAADQRFDGLALQVGMVLEGVVQIRDIGLVVS